MLSDEQIKDIIKILEKLLEDFHQNRKVILHNIGKLNQFHSKLTAGDSTEQDDYYSLLELHQDIFVYVEQFCAKIIKIHPSSLPLFSSIFRFYQFFMVFFFLPLSSLNSYLSSFCSFSFLFSPLFSPYFSLFTCPFSIPSYPSPLPSLSPFSSSFHSCCFSTQLPHSPNPCSIPLFSSISHLFSNEKKMINKNGTMGVEKLKKKSWKTKTARIRK